MVPLIEYGLGYQSQNKVQPDHFNHNNLNPNPKTDHNPNPKSKNNVCSTKRHLDLDLDNNYHQNKVQHSVIFLGTGVGL